MVLWLYHNLICLDLFSAKLSSWINFVVIPRSNCRGWGWQRTHIPILCHFPTRSIERIYYFEILTFRKSIDIYFKSTFLIFLTKQYFYRQKSWTYRQTDNCVYLWEGRGQLLPPPETGYATGKSPNILSSFQSLYLLCFQTFSSFFIQFRFYFLFLTFSPFFIFIDILFRLLGYEPYATLHFDKLISIKPRENPKDAAKPYVASIHPYSYPNLNKDGEPLPGVES